MLACHKKPLRLLYFGADDERGEVFQNVHEGAHFILTSVLFFVHCDRRLFGLEYFDPFDSENVQYCKDAELGGVC